MEIPLGIASNLPISFNGTVRWKITDGPAPEDTAYLAALAMQVQPLA